MLAGLHTFAPRAMALLLCLPLLGGRGLMVMIDTLAYPNGACCCERAHGARHHCHCMEPHDEQEASAVHGRGSCPDQWDAGGAEFDPPSLWAMPVATLQPSTQVAPEERDWSERLSATPLQDGRIAPPPTPPPIAPLSV